MAKQKIILDTDIGTDIDDVIALYYILENQNLELLGVTTVYENSIMRARIVKRVLELKGVDIPVYAGHGIPSEKSFQFIGTDETYGYFREEYLLDKYRPNNVDDNNGEEAVDFIIQMANQMAKTYGEELTVVAIGPLTNIAKAVEKAPDVMNKVKNLLIMGGNYGGQYAEWNIVCDVPSAKKVFTANINLSAIGLDVTLETELSRKVHDKILNGSSNDKLTQFIYEEIKLYTAFWERKIVLHDVLTVYSLTNPQVVLLKQLPIYLETEGVCGKGVTFNCCDLLANDNPKLVTKTINCATAINKEKFIKDMEDMLLKNYQVK